MNFLISDFRFLISGTVFTSRIAPEVL